MKDHIYVQVFDLHRPMTWQNFKRLPVLKQQEYLTYLREDIGATNAMIADMLGCEQSTVANRWRDLGLSGVSSQGHKPTTAQTERWNKWLYSPEPKRTPSLLAEKVTWLTT